MENNKFWGEFLDIYKELPELWKTNSEEYKNQNKKNLALNTMVEKLKQINPNADQRMVMNKINNFRSSYRRDLRKVTNSVKSGAGADDVFKSSLWYYPKLTFLNEADGSVASTSTMNESFEEEAERLEPQEDQSVFLTTACLYELKALQDAKKTSEYLALARTLPGYGDVVFPHCACDSRKEGHVVPAVGMKSFRLHACREDGSLEAQMMELTWDSITRWESDDESMSFCFQYNRPDKPARWVKVYTPYHAFLSDCYDRIMEERKWEDAGD